MNAAGLADLIASWGIPCVQGLHAAHCQAGAEYQVFSLPGNNEKTLAIGMQSQIRAYFDSWRRSHPDAKPTLYWRYDPPHVFWYPDDTPRRGRLSTRLVLSDKPVVWPDLAAYDAWRSKQIEDRFTAGVTDVEKR